jgi:hypothetical protein
VGKGVQVPVGVGVAVLVAVGEGSTRRTLARASKPDGAEASTQWVPTVAQPAGTLPINGPARMARPRASRQQASR